MDYIADSHATLRLNQIEQFPLVKLSQDDNHSSCSICISNFTKGEIMMILPCLHKFHKSCIHTWLTDNNTCPTCREAVMIDNVSTEDELSDEDVEFVENSDESMSDPSDPSVVFNLISSYFNTTDEVSLSGSSDYSVDDIIVDDSSDDSSISSPSVIINTTFEIDTEGGNSSITVSESSNESIDTDVFECQSNGSSNESLENNDDDATAMFPSSDETATFSLDDDSGDEWEMSDIDSD